MKLTKQGVRDLGNSKLTRKEKDHTCIFQTFVHENNFMGREYKSRSCIICDRSDTTVIDYWGNR